MNWQKKFNQEIFDIVNRYENLEGVKIDYIRLQSREIEREGLKTVDIESGFTEKERAVEGEKSLRSFLTSVLIPSIVTFVVLAILMEYFF